MKNRFHRDVFRAVLVLCLILAGCRFTMGGVAVLVALMGAGFAISRKPGYLACCYIMFPFFTVFNRVIVGISPVFLMTARLGNLFMIGAMILTGAGFVGRARERLPILWLFAYCFIACLSSIDGWMPFISYMKILQFVLFLLGLLFVTRLLQQSERGLYQLRCVFMALSLIFIWGSLVSKFIPSVGYSMTLNPVVSYAVEDLASNIAAGEKTVLFNGMTHHSQMLAPCVAAMAAWVLCDMLLVEKRFSALHVSTLAVAPVLLYMSRSRGGLLELVAVVFTSFFVCVPRAQISRAVRSRLSQMLLAIIAMLAILAVTMQIRNQSISKWIRKTEDIGGDRRSLKDAFTGSRQELVEYNLMDFKLNPLLGKGFQVVRGMEQAYRAKMITWYAAPVEKGVTPYVILGETGVFGAVVFCIFLASFYGTCLKRRYLSMLVGFTCFLVSNLADSTFFSPSGMGGFLWIVSCVGNFSTDLIAKRQNAAALQAQRFLPPRFA